MTLKQINMNSVQPFKLLITILFARCHYKWHKHVSFGILKDRCNIDVILNKVSVKISKQENSDSYENIN